MKLFVNGYEITVNARDITAGHKSASKPDTMDFLNMLACCAGDGLSYQVEHNREDGLFGIEYRNILNDIHGALNAENYYNRF